MDSSTIMKCFSTPKCSRMQVSGRSKAQVCAISVIELHFQLGVFSLIDVTFPSVLITNIVFSKDLVRSFTNPSSFINIIIQMHCRLEQSD